MKSIVTTPPTFDPLTVASVKSHLRVSGDAENDLILDYIKVATQVCEDYTGRKFANQTLTGYADGIDQYEPLGRWWSGARTGTYESTIANNKRCISLQWSPCSSVTSVHTIDDDGTETLLDSSEYYLDSYDDDRPSKIFLKDAATLPSPLRSRNNIKVVYVAGYGTAATSIPQKIKHAIRLIVADVYSKRGGCDEECVFKTGADSLLNSYRLEVI